MKQQINPTAVVALVAAAALLIISLGWYAVNRDTGVIQGGPEILPGVKIPHKMSSQGGAADRGGKRMLAPTTP